jgi:hypothetical protein
MRPLISFLTFFTTLFITRTNALASTDTITWGGSNDRSAYQNNHASVASRWLAHDDIAKSNIFIVWYPATDTDHKAKS